MAPVSASAIRSLVSAVTGSRPSIKTRDGQFFGSSAGPLTESARLLTRDKSGSSSDPSSGVLDPHDIKNVGFFVLFAVIGVVFVLTGIWFFFWAKNGGIHFKQNDWDDYKTTVLRRRGPNGTLLSGATPSTNLGGGSVYKDVEDDGTTVVTEGTALSGVTAGASDVGARQERRKKEERRQQRRKDRQETKRHVGEEGVEDEVAEKEAKNHLRSYRHERPARVGGLNKESEGSHWDSSTNPTASEVTATSTSELLSNRQRTPTSTPKGTPKGTPTKSGGGIRKVHSTADRQAEREADRIRAEARRLREAGRAAASSDAGSSGRRDFSYQRAAPAGSEGSSASESLLSGGDLGTKTYHHPLPELREQRTREREERRARRGGYRRGRGEEEL